MIYSGCAGQSPPSGGPPDTTPPEILSCYPTPGSLNFRDSTIEFEFTEYVDRRSVESSIFISPDVGKLEFNWGSTDVRVSLGGPLRDSTTYVVTIGTDVVDTRNRNHLATAFNLAFSTGNRIDSGSFSGKVFDANPAGVMIFGYQAEGRNLDTLDPSHTKPDYLTQTGKEGSFHLPYLRIGKYRLIAVDDVYRNLLYDVQTDRYSVLSEDKELTLEHPSVDGLRFRLAKEDTSPPFISNALFLNRSQVIVRLSEPVDIPTSSPLFAHLQDTVNGDSLHVEGVWFAGPARNELLIATDSGGPFGVLRLSVTPLQDLSRNLGTDSGFSYFCLRDSLADTTAPSLSRVIVGDTLVPVCPTDQIHWFFTEPVTVCSLSHAISLMDSSGDTLEFNASWESPLSVVLAPEKEFAFGMRYTLDLILDSLRDYAGNKGRDSTVRMKIDLLSRSTLSSLKGSLDVGEGVSSLFIVTAEPVSTKPRRTVSIQRVGSGKFELSDVPEGRYVLCWFEDLDGNGVRSPGTPYPFVPSERFGCLAETLKVRARWPIEGIDLKAR